MSRSQPANIWVGIIGLCLLVLASIGLWQHQYLADLFRASQFVPDEGVARIVDDTAMTERGRMLFYASSPVLQPAEQFNKSCEGVEKSAVVLGCYSGQFIYIYDIDNQELAGIKEVTAAHEMLHAAYDRLSSSRRLEVDNMLAIAAEDLRSNTALQERLEAYDFRNTDERYNELHSIIGTEVAELRPELESHYSRYFADRSKVVALYQQYSGVFVKYRQQAEQLAASLDQLAATINQQNNSYTTAVEMLNRDIDAFNRRAQSTGGFSSQSDFDQARNLLTSRQENLQQQRRNISQQVERYNGMLERYNGISRHISSLNNSIDSRIVPAPEMK